MATPHNRVFEDRQATRERVPLMVGLMGPSGSGKTYSALRLATGFQRVSGGDIYMIDTEARRGLHYADRFKFRHLVFGSPFGPLDYLAAIEHCAAKGATTVIVDSMSHEHEGPGGVLEMHEAEVDRMGGGETNNFRAWAKPKAERRRMINTILQLPCNFVFCFRAKEKTKPGPDRKLIEQGYMPIAGEEFVFEMTVNALLLPNANGIPTWGSDFRGESQMIKLPEQFRAVLGDNAQLNENIGERLATWAAGAPPVPRFLAGKEWSGKPLADAPTDVLATYKGACTEGLSKKKGADAEAMRIHIADITKIIESRLTGETNGVTNDSAQGSLVA